VIDSIKLCKTLRQLRESKAVKAVVLRVDSPGESCTQSWVIDFICNFTQRKAWQREPMLQRAHSARCQQLCHPAAVHLHELRSIQDVLMPPCMDSASGANMCFAMQAARRWRQM